MAKKSLFPTPKAVGSKVYHLDLDELIGLYLEAHPDATASRGKAFIAKVKNYIGAAAANSGWAEVEFVGDDLIAKAKPGVPVIASPVAPLPVAAPLAPVAPPATVVAKAAPKKTAPSGVVSSKAATSPDRAPAMPRGPSSAQH